MRGMSMYTYTPPTVSHHSHLLVGLSITQCVWFQARLMLSASSSLPKLSNHFHMHFIASNRAYCYFESSILNL